jgi:D-sedoheptulose 7-phosphate isomerase
MTDRVRAWLDEAASVIATIDAQSVARVSSAIVAARDRGAQVFVVGNGGSATTATHMALDFQKAGRDASGKGAKALALSDNQGLVTAWANDTSFDRVFAEQIDVLAEPGDVLILVSVSGSSPNLVAAIEAARARGVATIGLLGAGGGTAARLVDHAVVTPSRDYGWVESAHVVLLHVFTYSLRDSPPPAVAAERV